MLIYRLTTSLFSFKNKLFFSTSIVKSRDWATIMGKVDPNLKHIQKQRIEKREKRSQDPATSVFFQILGNGASGGPKSIFMFTDYNRYLFNCGEATQKIFCEHTNHKSLGQVSSIFITKRNWDNMGGLPGMCLSMRTAGCPDVTIHGPPGVMKLYDSTKHFVVLHDFGVKSHQISDGIFEDNVLTVQHIPLCKNTTEAFIAPEPKYCKWEGDFKGSLNAINGVEIDQTVNSYIMTIKPRPITIDMEKVKALGLKPGPVIGVLKKGNNITTEDGRVITPADVSSGQEDPLTYLFIDCPSLEYLPSLLNEPLLKPNHSGLAHIQGVFHLSPLAVVKDPKYVEWINSFPATTRNIMLNENSSGYGSCNAVMHNGKLNKIAPELMTKVINKEQHHVHDENAYENIKNPIIQGSSNMKIMVRPFMHRVTEIEVGDPMEEFEKLLSEDPKIEKVLEQVHANIRKTLVASNMYEAMGATNSNARDFPKIHFLGTGSAVPNKYRNVSAILVETQPDQYMLLDCGEGTLLQMHRHFGREKTLEVLKQLKAVYVSHLHPDHHLGLLNLVIQRDRYFKQLDETPTKMYVLAPARIANYLKTYHQYVEPCLTNLHHIWLEHVCATPAELDMDEPENDTNYLNPWRKSLDEDVFKEMIEYLQLNWVKTCRAIHAPGAFCVAFITKQNFKFAYSGDTRPIEAFVRLGKMKQKTDLLIHESTHEHRMLGDCQAKMHSTFTEAVRISQRMEAKQTIFTHFSQRYAKLPVLEEFEVKEAKNCAIAFDHMTVTPKTFNVIKEMYPALKYIFSEELEEIQKKVNYRMQPFEKTIEQNLEMDNNSSVDSDLKQPLDQTTKRRQVTLNKILGQQAKRRKSSSETSN